MIVLTLFLEFFKVGLFCIGGGLAMIPLIEEIVLAHGWATQSQFYDFVGICESTPGPIAVNTATYIGSLQAGFAGSLAATLGVVLPGYLVILLIVSLLTNLVDNRYFKGFMKGVKPVVIALILSTGVQLLINNLGIAAGLQVVPLVIFALLVAFYFGWKRLRGKKPSSILIILLSAVLGIVCSLLAEVWR